jgi:hypothetical protein
MRRNETLYLGIGMFTALAVSVVYCVWQEKYPANEWHSRHDCRYHMGDIRTGLGLYVVVHDGKMPTDLYEMVVGHYLDKSDCICPARYNSVRKAGFLRDDCPLFASSYRLLIAGKKLAEVPDGAVVLQEFAGNHPEAVVGEYSYQAGYHVIVKDGNALGVDFIDTPPAGRLTRE